MCKNCMQFVVQFNDFLRMFFQCVAPPARGRRARIALAVWQKRCGKSTIREKIIIFYLFCAFFSIVCGTTGKRKACKDCSCGLAEEIQAGKPSSKKTVTSSCGSVSVLPYGPKKVAMPL